MLEGKELQVSCLSLIPGAVFGAFKTACCHRSTKTGFCSQCNGLEKNGSTVPQGDAAGSRSQGRLLWVPGSGRQWVRDAGRQGSLQVREDRHHAE